MSKHTVVIVEDDPIQRMGATAAFAEAGLDTVEFETAEDASLFVRQNQDDVLALFTDVRTPGDLDGMTLAAQIAFACPRIVLLVTSGHPEGILERLPPNGYFIPKPWRAADLATAIEHVQDRLATAA